MVSWPGKTGQSDCAEASQNGDYGFRDLSSPVLKPLTTAAIARHSNHDRRSGPVPVEREAAATTLAEEHSDAIAVAAIRQQLERILQSSAFVQSGKLSQFLRFIVEHVITDSQNCLKEYLIGAEVYDRKPPYHPSQDSIVRTEARRLRGKLKSYYEVEGKDDPIYIYLRPGSYIPAFQHREVLLGDQRAVPLHDSSVMAKASAMVIAILPFIDISGSATSATYARGIPDELAYQLMTSADCRVLSLSSMAHLWAEGDDVATVMNKVGAHVAFEGSVRADGNLIRITARIVDAAGFMLWVKRVDVDADSHRLFAIEEKIASALSAGVDAIFSESLDRSAM